MVYMRSLGPFWHPVNIPCDRGHVNRESGFSQESRGTCLDCLYVHLSFAVVISISTCSVCHFVIDSFQEHEEVGGDA
jgi:hypothetical protein